MGTGDILLGGNPPVQGGVAILLGLLHTTETGIQPCGAFTYLPPFYGNPPGGGGGGGGGWGIKPLILL